MLKHAEDVELFQKAKYFVGCSSEDADRIYFKAEDAIENLGDHEYVAGFDANGTKLGEVKIEHWQDSQYRVRTDY